MPNIKRRTKRRADGYHEFHVMQLQLGFDLWGKCNHWFAAFGNDDDFDRTAAKEAWGVLGEQILRDWTCEHPGQRPAAWSWFEAPERRRRVDGVQHPFDDRVRKKKHDEMPDHYWAKRHAYDLHFGVPRIVSGDDMFAAKYESEAEYLERLGLLTEAERKELFE